MYFEHGRRVYRVVPDGPPVKTPHESGAFSLESMLGSRPGTGDSPAGGESSGFDRNIIQLGSDGSFNLYNNNGTTQFDVDLFGYFYAPIPQAPVPASPSATPAASPSPSPSATVTPTTTATPASTASPTSSAG